MSESVLKKNEMPLQDPSVRSENFSEVALGYSKELAIKEAKRCLNCKNKPCMKGCPVGIDIPCFVKEVANENFEEAYKIINKASSLPAICGRVCPQEKQCEGKCVRGIKGESVGIGYLERFVADLHNLRDSSLTKILVPKFNGHKIGIVGSGPAGLSCAGELARRGYEVLIFEALHKPGGVLIYGIPEFRLPKNIVEKEINELYKLGVKIFTNVVVGKTVTLEELMSCYGCEYVFIASGAGLPRFMGITGENLKGVYSANEFLTRVNLMKAYDKNSDTFVKNGKQVVVVGGGNVAMDAARCAKRLGAEKVSVVYRRSEQELPARAEEVIHAKEEGIDFCVLTNPVKILGDDKGFVSGIQCVNMKLSGEDSSGRRRPEVIPGSEHVIDCDMVIMSIGTSLNPLIASTTKNLIVDKKGCIVADERTGKTSLDNVYAGGDAVTGAATVILAMGAGKNAAMDIHDNCFGIKK